MSSLPKTYRLCTFDGVRMVLSAELIKAASDAEALAQARAEACGKKAELWDGQRLVAVLDSETLLPPEEWGLPGTLSPSF